MAFIPREYNDPLCVYSLRLLTSGYGGPIARVVRGSDLIEGDVYPDSNNQISYDSTIIVNPDETSALTLGEFLNISGYDNPDELADVYEARINKLYDQSAAVNHVESPNFATSLAFVEHTLPAIFPNSTNIHTVNGIPSFLPLSTIPALTINNVRGRELSFHFVSENTSAVTYFGFINPTPYYTISGAWNESNNSVTTGVSPFSSEAWLMSDNYYNGVLGDVAGEFTRTRIGIPTDDSLVCTIQAQLLDTSYTQSDFPDNSVTFRIFANQWYADIIVYDGYDNIRRLTIEDLLSSGNVNVETKAFTSTLAFTDDGTADNSFIAQFGTPAAAYSVRSLRGLTGLNGPKVLRVRREVDNAEADVYTDPTGWVSLDSPVAIVPAITGQIDGGTGVEIDSLASTLGEFVADGDHDDVDSLGSPTTAKVVVWYDQSSADYTIISEEIDARGAPVRIRVVGGTYDAYEFDLYFDDNESISLSSYVADTYEISDGATQVTANLTLGTLQTLVDAGMTEATVCVWYDQSGNNNDATQTTAGNQPKIYYSSTGVITPGSNSKPAIDGDGNDYLRTAAISTEFANGYTYYAVVDDIGFNRYPFIYGEQDISTSFAMWCITIASGKHRNNSVITSPLQRGDTDGLIQSVFYDGATNVDVYMGHQNGTQNSGSNTVSALASTTGGNILTLFSSWSSGNPFQPVVGQLQELIIWPSDQSNNRTGIESNINTYYDIYGTGNTGVNTPLLDTYSGAAAAYSLRKLRTSYNGPVNLSKRKDAIQNVATAQPKIYDSVTGVVKENGRVAVQGTSSSTELVAAISHTVTAQSTFGTGTYVYGLNDRFISQNNGGNDYSAIDAYIIGYANATNTISSFLDAAARSSITVSNNQHILFSSVHSGSSLLNAVNGTTGTAYAHTLNSTFSRLGIMGTGGSVPEGWQGKMQEVVMYDADKSTDRIDIENNINSAFQIYAANFSSVLDTVPLAKAAYSIRRLTKNYIGPIITVTNGSTTKDFYADFWGNLNSDALTEFANGGTLSVTRWWDQSGEGVHLLTTSTRPTLTIANNEVSVNTTNKFYEPLLDRYEGAAAAYSLRILKGDYTGPLVRVRRDVTNTEVDVYPDENLTISLNSPVLNVVTETTTGVTVNPLDTLANTLGEFVADAGDDPDGLGAPVSAFVVVWYDQANSNNASQDISTAQPKIYDSVDGVIVENGKPAVDFNGDFLRITGTGQLNLTETLSLFSIHKPNIFNATTVISKWYNSPNQIRPYIFIYVNNALRYALNSNAVRNDIPTDISQKLMSFLFNKSTQNVFSINGSATTFSYTSSLTASESVDIAIGAESANSPINYFVGTQQEIVLYPFAEYTNRTGIESNINNHYQIPNFNATASTAQTVAVYNNAINTTVDLNATYTDLKEIIKYE